MTMDEDRPIAPWHRDAGDWAIGLARRQELARRWHRLRIGFWIGIGILAALGPLLGLGLLVKAALR
jgi:hypothetical protein